MKGESRAVDREEAGREGGLLDGAVAIIGMAGRFPGARDLGEFWSNLRGGVESIRRLSEEELAALGVDPELRADPRYVPVASVLPDPELFDASFFGFSPREAEILDPQQRLLLETAWAALENAGYDPQGWGERLVGVFAAATTSTYLMFHLMPNAALRRSMDPLSLLVANAHDSVATRLAYKLNLRGPSFTVACACSSSLVALHNACQSLLGEECDLAVAGGVSVNLAQRAGYLYTPDSILSPDGHCRTFDAQARGSVFGSGVGLVVLKRAEDALADGDEIRALILGSAVNNDGSLKVGFTAPSVEGQAGVISEALAVSGVRAEEIQYVEAHGTATRLGDPVEIQALTRAWRGETEKTGFARIGAVKSNVGHLDTAAGAAGLIKTVLSLQHGEMVPSLHCQQPSPEIDWSASPVVVNSDLRPWERPAGGVRRAGVSAFGLGGTNAHVILEEAPEREPSAPPARPWQLLVLSARTGTALEAASSRLAAYLSSRPELGNGAGLADAAWTLQAGRHAFGQRRIVAARDAAEAVKRLTGEDPRWRPTAVAPPQARRVAYLLPGVGDHYAGMGRGLYASEEVFRREFDRCAEILAPHLGLDLRQALFPAGAASPAGSSDGKDKVDLRRMLRRGGEGAGEPSPLAKTSVAHASIFAVEWALAKQWTSWGVEPAALLGYSTGEWVAACLAGVFSLEDALGLIVGRARLIEATPPGGMLAVPLGEEQLRPHLGEELAVAAVDGPAMTVVAGTAAAVSALGERLSGEGLVVGRVEAGHGFHSPLLRPQFDALAALVAAVPRNAPQIPYLSNVTGGWITAEEAADPLYWARHMCEAVQLSSAVASLWAEEDYALLEVGPGHGLGALVRQHPAYTAVAYEGARGEARERVVLGSLRPVYESGDDGEMLVTTLGRLWLAGVEVDWEAFHGEGRRRRVPLPSYPFEGKRYWIEAPGASVGAAAAGGVEEREAGAATAVGKEAAAGAPGPGSAPAGEAAAFPAQTFHPRPTLEVPLVAARDQDEERMGKLWEELLGVAPVGIYDGFLELGGHSLLGTQLISRVQEDFGVALSLRALFDAPTVAELVTVMREEAAHQGEPGHPAPLFLPPLGLSPRRQSGEPFPLSSAQERMWFLCQFDAGTHAFNLPSAVWLDGRLDRPALASSLARLPQRHEVLRSRFTTVNGQTVAELLPAQELPLPVVDLSGLAGAAREAARRELILRRSRHRFDLAGGKPLAVALLLHLGVDKHQLLVVAHHVASDGWSGRVLVRDLARLYRSRVQGVEAELPELPFQYLDYVEWQRQHIAGEALAAHMGYWRPQLAGLPFLELPTDRPRPPLQTFAGANEPLRLSPRLAAAVESLAAREGKSPFMVLLSAYGSLLGLAAQQDDFAVGTLIAGRNRPEVENVVGLFVNNLPLRLDLGGRPTVREVLNRARGTTLAAYEHQDLPYEKLLEQLNPERDTSRPPLFQACFILLNLPRIREELSGVVMEVENVLHDHAHFDITLWVTETPEGSKLGAGPGLGGWLEYNTDLFDRTTVERWARSFEALLAAMAAAPGQTLAELPMLSPAQRQQLLVEWNDSDRPLPAGADTLSLIAARVAAAPDAVAAEEEGAQVTYAHLDAGAARIGRQLAAHGAGPGAVVALLAERGIPFLTALLGIWKAGGVYLPPDPRSPASRIGGLIEASKAAVVVADRDLGARLEGELPASSGPSGGPVILSLEELLALPGEAAEDALPLPIADPEELAYVLYTSGSTGLPKGAMVRHEGMLNHLQLKVADLGLRAADAVAQNASQAFDISVWQLVAPLVAGARVVLYRDEVSADAARLLDRCQRDRVSVLEVVPSLLAVVLDEVDRRGPQRPSLSRLRWLIPTGEALPPELARRWLEAYPQIPLVNAYGPTECSDDVTHQVLSRPLPAGTVRAPIGRPVDNLRLYLLGRSGRPVPFGSSGEIYAGGRGVGRGYLGEPRRTADVFVPDPLGAAGSRLYRTGDLARALGDGRIEYLGRTDFQVKIRGVRIETGEIEAALQQHPEVSQCLVLAREAAPGDQRLACYLVARGEAAPEPEALRSFLAQRLPQTMVPAAFTVLAEFPLTPNGKVDRKALPEPEWSSAHEAEYVAPEGPVEERLAEIWCEVLGVGRVGALDNFFERGGHSLLAAQVAARIRQEFDIELPLPTLFAMPTLAELALAVEEALIEKVNSLSEEELARLL